MTISRRNVVIGSVLFLAAVVAVLVTVHSGSSVDEYVAQLRARGEQIYFTDPPYPKMTNGTPQLDKFVAAANKLTIFSVDAMHETSPGVAEVSWRRETFIEYIHNGKTNSLEWPELGTKLARHEAELTSIRESLSEPEPDMGWHTNLSRPRPIIAQQRIAACALAAATLHALHERDPSGAFTNVVSLAHLSRLERDEVTLVLQMIRVAVAELGLAVTWESLQTNCWSDGQLSQMQCAWRDVDLLQAFERALTGERMYVYDYMRQVREGLTNAFNWNGSGARHTFRERVLTRLWRATVAKQDQMLYLRTMERFIEDARATSRGTSVPEVGKLLQKDNDDVVSLLDSRLALWKYPLTSVCIPNFVRAHHRVINIEIQRRLTVMAIAIARYQRRYGKLPESLQALVPEFCAEVLLDPMDWKPLRYRLNGDGTFTLYSVGDNGIDDHGDASPGKTQQTDLFSGLDIVWPRAVQTH